jgi:D-3-phosphoglycerate dehydrogenase / 2-oxoglutarate reductase
MSRFRVVVTDQVFPTVDVEREVLAAVDADLEVAEGGLAPALAAAADADGVLNTYLPLDAAALGRLAKCQVVARYGVGVDNIDLEAARRAGMVVTNVPDYCAEEVAAHTVAMALAVLRRLPAGHAHVTGGGWGIAPLRPLRRLSSMTAGVVGYGRIGRIVAGHLRALGMAVVAHDPYASAADTDMRELDDLLAVADLVTLHCPLTSSTRGLIGEARLARMKPGAVLVNTSRGPLVERAALVRALNEGHLAGAGLDVFEQEPPDGQALRDVPGLLVTPHVAFYSEEAVAESQRKAATQVAKVLTGEPPDYPVVPR